MKGENGEATTGGCKLDGGCGTVSAWLAVDALDMALPCISYCDRWCIRWVKVAVGEEEVKAEEETDGGEVIDDDDYCCC